MATSISSAEDLLDVRDIIARVEELEEERGDVESEEIGSQLKAWDEGDDGQELKALTDLLEELAGSGGDEEWRGDWYPLTLIRDSYFVEAMQELVQDIGDLPREIPHYLEIDWEKTADNLRADYSSVEYDGITYWYR